MSPQLGRHYHHGPSGVVGAVTRVFAPDEHPTATREVVRLSTGDELVWKPDDFQALTAKEVAVYTEVPPVEVSGQLCADCGAAAPWWYAVLEDGPRYCRRCWRRGGLTDAAFVDPDKLVELLGVEGALKVLAKARAT